MKRRRIGMLLAAAMTGCAIHPPAAPPAMAPNFAPFVSRTAHLRCSYPRSWHPIPDAAILCLVPAGQTARDGQRLVIDTPNLPPHIPFLIPLNLVADGFVDDIKKRYKIVSVSPLLDRPLGGLAGREVNATARDDDVVVVLRALLCVNGDRVFVIDTKTELAGAAAAARIFDAVVDSLQWTH
jgi:hypothetical protein